MLNAGDLVLIIYVTAVILFVARQQTRTARDHAVEPGSPEAQLERATRIDRAA